MTKEVAEREAREIARTESVDMVVAFNPYGEEEDEADRFGYYPAAAARIFVHEEVVVEIAADEVAS